MLIYILCSKDLEKKEKVLNENELLLKCVDGPSLKIDVGGQKSSKTANDSETLK